MLLESSEVGATLYLEKVPRPPGVSLSVWLNAYPGFAFLLSVAPSNTHKVLDAFKKVNVEASVIGEITGDQRIVLQYAGTRILLVDLSCHHITGIKKMKS